MRRFDREIIGKEVHNYAQELNRVVFRGKGNIGKKRNFKKHFVSCMESDLKKYNMTPLDCEMFKCVKVIVSCETYDLKNGEKVNYNKYNSIKGGTFTTIKDVKMYLDKLRKENDMGQDFKEVKLYIKNPKEVISYFRKISIEKIEFSHTPKKINNAIKFSKYEGLSYIHRNLKFEKVIK